MSFPDNLSTLHSLPSITNPPQDTLAYQPVRNHVSFAQRPRYQNQQSNQQLPYRPQSHQSSNRPRPRINQTSQQPQQYGMSAVISPGTSQNQHSGHQVPHHSVSQTSQHQFAVFQPNVPPTLSQLLTR